MGLHPRTNTQCSQLKKTGCVSLCLTCLQIRTFCGLSEYYKPPSTNEKRLKSAMMEKGCQFHMGNSNVIPMRLHLHVQSQN